MKKILTIGAILISLGLSLSVNADAGKMDGLLKLTLREPAAVKAMLGKACAIKGARETIECLVKSNDAAATEAAITKAGGEVRAHLGSIMSVSIPLDALEDISGREEVMAIEAARPLTSKMNEARNFTFVTEVQAGDGLDQAYNGSGVLIGVVDEAIDWLHQDFRDADGGTRICYITGKYSADDRAECSKADIDGGTCYVSRGGFAYHGTHVTGIAASSDEVYRGVAPESLIAFGFFEQEGDTMEEFQQLFTTAVLENVSALFAKAKELDLPAVINISLGTSFGPHDDSSLFEQGLNEAVEGERGRAIVIAAGNENVNPNDDAANGYRLGGIHAELDEDTTNRGWKIDMRRLFFAADVETAAVDVWLDNTPECRNSTIEVKAYRRFADDTQIVNDALQMTAIDFTTDQEASKVTTDGKVGVTVSTFAAGNATNNRPEAIILFGPVEGVGTWEDIIDSVNGYYFHVILRVPAGTCKGDMWLYPDSPFIIVFRKGIAGTNVAGADPYQLADGDSNKTMTIPATASQVIAVGSYMGRGQWTDINDVVHNQTDYDLGQLNSLGETGGTVGDVSLFSSLGPTGEVDIAEQRIKPDMVAPGEPIISTKSSGSHFASGRLGDSTHVKLDGTSMAAPHVAGIVALMLEKNNCLTAAEVKSYLQSTATATGANPNNEYGYGKVNALAAMQAIAADKSCFKGDDCEADGDNGDDGNGESGGGGCVIAAAPASSSVITMLIAVILPLGILVFRKCVSMRRM